MRYVQSLLFTLFLLLVLGSGAAYIVYQHYASDLPDFEQLADYQPPIMTRVHAGDGRLLAEYATERRVFVPISAIPPRVVQAMLAAEDREFFTHGGVNPAAMVRAALQNLLHVGQGRRQIGASTITQQVAKNMLLGNEYSMARKVKEAILAVRMEQALTKERILELYLNEINFGRGAYGIATGALVYFNKSVDELTVSEAAFLAGAVKGPTNYDPARHYDAAKGRRDYVIDGMAKIGAITEAEAKAAEAEPIVLKKRDETQVFSAPYYTEEVRRELLQRFGEDRVYKSGLSVRTSLDPILQSYADKALRDGLVTYDRRHGWRGPVNHLDLAADAKGWQQALAAVPMPGGAAPWKLALVREVKPDAAEIGFADGTTGTLPMKEMEWARPTTDDQHVGASPKTAEQVVKRGDVVLVEAIMTEAPAVKPAAKGKGAKVAAVEPAVPPPPPTFSHWALRQIPNVSGAIVALDPHTGRVLAMDGGWSYDTSQFNRATQAYRQIGSTFKPFAYLAALDNGMTPSTLILDDPIELEQGPGLPMWRPHNFEGGEAPGPQPLRVAIEKSLNLMTVRMATTIGIDKIAPYIERLGLMDKMPLLYAQVLGAGQTTPLKLATAYAMLDNGGKHITPSLIDRVEDREGKIVFKHDTRACPRCGDYAWGADGGVPSLPDEREQVLDPATAYQMVNIMQGVIQRGTAASSVGSFLKMPLAGKTGTTNDIFDTWFVGFTPDLVVAVYVGFDTPRTLGRQEQGARTAAPLFTEFMTDALKDKPAVDFRIPPGVRLVRVNAATGQLAEGGERNVIWEAFKPGTEPSPSDQVVDGGGIEPGSIGDVDQSNPPMDDQSASSVGQPQQLPPPGAVAGAMSQPGNGGLPATLGGAVPPPPQAPTSASPLPPPPRPATAPSTGTGGLY
ncbi:MAG TPA: penicillin-binding protein 1A [Aliidongia sp.]|uniref:penicillin-binding protein 1A n=1 Tax=Aliidongia sp. TaxID=1914230 RepID=UPI002DDCD650|nr:penicillin-binding protein 1A [Aliidongia sp.]HEV2674385.1 penicillin-binding protein 1A [Aliidongia sp.]